VASCELAIGLQFVYTVIAMASISVHKNKRGRGRPATGHDPPITTRVPTEVLKALEKWAQLNGCTRSEAACRLLTQALDSEAKKR
jgi:hypothetical protein